MQKRKEFKKTWENWILHIEGCWLDIKADSNFKNDDDKVIKLQIMVDLLIDKCRQFEAHQEVEVLKKLNEYLLNSIQNKELIGKAIDFLKAIKITLEDSKKFKIGLNLGRFSEIEKDLKLMKDGYDWEEYKEIKNEEYDLIIADIGIEKKYKNNVIFIGKTGSFEERLVAVRRGGVGFVKNPEDSSDLWDLVERETNKKEPYKILVVDDSETFQSIIKKTLENEGMSVKTASNGFDGFKIAEDFKPDLMLVDMYMPGCSGKELSIAIRQCDHLNSIPIVFLSSESDIKKQIDAMQIGADDFLTKPINPDVFVDSIKARVERHRIINSNLDKDTLTGLLNHTKLKQRLDQSIEKAVRSKIKMAFVMIDIDHFKRVNDQHGHAAGDAVLKALSGLLKNRLRKTDSLGRYGGEEFGIVLWDIDLKGAENLINDLRIAFEKMKHESQTDPETSFSCTFSAGIATFPSANGIKNLTNSADKALYQAKRSGRNCVKIAFEI